MTATLPETLDKAQLRDLGPAEVRALYRAGRYKDNSWSVCPGFAQTAFVGLPRALALDFMIFAQRNPRPCPVLEVFEPGPPISRKLAPGADLRSDLGKYRVFRDGELIAEPYDVGAYWRDDMIGFLIGCTGSFEPHMVRSGIRLRYLEQGKTAIAYVTNIACEPAGALRAPLAVSMRPIHWTQVEKAVQLTSRFPAFHGAPVHVGDPNMIGIDIDKPWGGKLLDIAADEVPVFWACSVTPQLMAVESKVEFMITNMPAFMFISDVPTEQMAIVA